MSGPNDKHRRELYRVISWVLRTRNLGLKIQPEWDKTDNGRVVWKLRGICDATWGSDPDDGRSVIGYILYFMNVPISWKSKTLTRCSLSSTEAEYCAASELVKEVTYVMQILEHMHIYIELPVDIYMDNIGAIYMARNNKGGTGTRHVNIRYNYCREVHGKLIRLIFVKSSENEADILTKNPTKAEHERHSAKLIGMVPENFHPKN